MAMTEPLATHYVVDDEEDTDETSNVVDEEDWDETSYALKLEMLRQFDYDLQNERDLETAEDVAAEVEVQATSGHMLQLCLPFQNDIDGETTIPSPPIATIEPQNIDVENWNESISLNDKAVMKVSSTIEEQFPNDDDDEITVSKSRLSSIASQLPSYGTEVHATSGHGLTSSHENDIDSNILGLETKMKQTAEGNQDFVENVSGLEIPSIANSDVLMNGQSKSQQCLIDQLGEIDTAVIPSQINNLESSTSAATLSTTSETKNGPPIQLDVASKQKDIEKTVEGRTTSTYEKTITSTHLEDGDGKISIPSFSTSTKPAATKYVDIGDSQETIAIEDINNLIEDDPLLAFETLLTGQVSISYIRVLLQELKTLMDSSSDLYHLVSNQESKSKLISLFHQLNQHQGMLTSDLKDFVEKVQNFFNENIIKHTTSQQVLDSHNKLLDSKSDLMNKLWSAKKTQAHIDSETSTANAHIQIDDLKSVMKKCDVQKMKLKAECTEWAQQSKELTSALASSKVAVIEVECVRNLANEDFANLKSSFPTF